MKNFLKYAVVTAFVIALSSCGEKREEMDKPSLSVSQQSINMFQGTETVVRVLPGESSYTWSSSNSAVVSVAAGDSEKAQHNENLVMATGTVSGVGPGTATISVTDGKSTAMIAVRVSEFFPVTDITLPTLNARPGEMSWEFANIQEVFPSNATNRLVAWSIVSGAGTVVALRTSNRFIDFIAPGTAVIRATVTNGRTPSSNFTKDFTLTVAN